LRLFRLDGVSGAAALFRRAREDALGGELVRSSRVLSSVFATPKWAFTSVIVMDSSRTSRKKVFPLGVYNVIRG
jgi:hypothetical protein